MCAYYGVTGWFFEVDDFATEEQRLYSVSLAAVKVLQTNFAFQTWDFAVSFLHKELNAPEMLAHHSLAALLCYWGLTMPYMHYYAIYFMGVAEVSSVPLVLVDICKYYPSSPSASRSWTCCPSSRSPRRSSPCATCSGCTPR